MDNLIKEANERLQSIIDDLLTIKEEYERKIAANAKEIDTELAAVKKYKKEFYDSKEKVEKMNSDIESFENDYESLVNRFKDDELASILVNVNKEISAKIEERKKQIIKDKHAMNTLVSKAEDVKDKLVSLNAEKNALDACYAKIIDAYDFYNTCLSQVISYSNENPDDLCSYFEEDVQIIPFDDETIENIKRTPIIEDENDIDVEEQIETEFEDDEEFVPFDIDELDRLKNAEASDEYADFDGKHLDDIKKAEESDEYTDFDEEELIKIKEVEASDEYADFDNESLEIMKEKEKRRTSIVEENIEFTEEDFVPDEAFEGVIDLNALNNNFSSDDLEDDDSIYEF